MEGTIVYLTGPMITNSILFHRVADNLRAQGYAVINPVESDEENVHAQVRANMESLLLADMVVVLPDWNLSVGACTEVLMANALGIPVYDYSDIQHAIGIGVRASGAGISLLYSLPVSQDGIRINLPPVA